MEERYRSGYFRAMVDHWMVGPRTVKRKASAGVEGASIEWMKGYRDYSRKRCVVRRYEEFVNHI